MYELIDNVIRVIDTVNESVGRLVSWLIVAMVLTTFAVAVLRYGFSIGRVWLQESYVWMHATVFMVASGYTLLHDGHVRIDLIYSRKGPLYRAWVNLLGVLILLLPALVAVGLTSFPYVVLSWSRLETSSSSGGLPGLFLLKTTILAFVLLLGLQGVSLMLKSVRTILYGDVSAQ